MSNLTVQNSPNISPKLSSDEHMIVLSGIGTKIKDLTKVEIATELADIITKTVFEAGQSTDTVKLTGTINSVYPDLKTYFSTLTMNDVKCAFHFGVRKEYGEYMGINPTTIFLWLKGYLGDPKRHLAKQKQAQFILDINKPKELSEEVKESLVRHGVIRAFILVKNGNEFFDLGNVCYNYLNKNNKIQFTKDRKKEILEKSRIKLKNKYMADMEGGNSTFRKQLKDRLLVIETQNTDELKIEAKRIALIDFFTDLIAIDENIKNLI